MYVNLLVLLNDYASKSKYFSRLKQKEVKLP